MSTQGVGHQSENQKKYDATSDNASFFRAAFHLNQYPNEKYRRALVIGASQDVLNHLRATFPEMVIVIGNIASLPNTDEQKDEPLLEIVTINPAALTFPDDTFDIVICNNAFSVLPQYHHLMRELLRVLRPGMPFIVTAKQKARLNFLSTKKDTSRTFSRRELADMFQNFHMTGVRTSGLFSDTASAFGKKHLLRVKHSGVVHLPSFEDSKGGMLVTAEFGKTVPFDAKRVYVISNVTGRDAVRGGHAHKALDQAIFCVSGSFELRIDDGSVYQKVVMKNNGYGLRLGPKLWHSMRRFSSDCVILVFASDYYDESDYIRNYDDFKKYIVDHP